LTISVAEPDEVPDATYTKFIEAQLASAVTVIVLPGAILTSSLEAGTTPPDHVLVAFQSPVATVVLVTCPHPLPKIPNKKTQNSRARRSSNVVVFIAIQV
jgi:hypothetical protein